MESAPSNILQLYASGEAPLLVTLGLRPDLSMIVQREKMHCAGLGPLFAELIALVLSYLTKATDANYAELRALTLQNGKDLEVTYLLLRNQVGGPFENATTKQKLAYLENFYNHDDNWNSRRTFYIPQEYKPKETASSGIAVQETKRVGTAGELLAANNLLGLADTLRSQQATEKNHVPLRTQHTEPTVNPTCAVITTTDETDRNVKPPHGDSRQHEETPVLNSSEIPTNETFQLTDRDSHPGSDRNSTHEQSELTGDEDDDAGGSSNAGQDDDYDSDYDYNRDPRIRLSAVEEEKNQASYRDKDAKRVERRRQAIKNLPHLSRRELKQ
jgi:hypothetical protein